MNSHRLVCSLLMIFAIAWLGPGCGKKGPPLPPKDLEIILNQPFGLEYQLNQDFLVIQWKYDFEQSHKKAELEGFDIYMAKIDPEQCTGCPIEFEKIDFVAAPALDYTMHILKGFRYYFKVQADGDSKIKSEFSNTVEFEY